MYDVFQLLLLKRWAACRNARQLVLLLRSHVVASAPVSSLQERAPTFLGHRCHLPPSLSGTDNAAVPGQASKPTDHILPDSSAALPLSSKPYSWRTDEWPGTLSAPAVPLASPRAVREEDESPATGRPSRLAVDPPTAIVSSHSETPFKPSTTNPTIGTQT